MSITLDGATGATSWPNRTQYPFRGRFMDVNGGRMHYIDEGTGDPIVFVHGLPTWSFMYRHLIRGLWPSYRCVAIDMIGFGLSEKPATWGYSPHDQARNLAAVIEALGLEKVTLVAHDFGAPVAMSYAVDNPGNVSRFVAFNSFCWNLKGDPHAERVGVLANSLGGKLMMTNVNGWAGTVARMFGNRQAFTTPFQEAIAGPATNKEDRFGLWSTAKCFSSCGPYFDEIWSRRKELCEVPFLFLWGMKDKAFGEKALNKWWHEFPMAQVEQYPAAGHYPMEEQPADVLKAMNGFLAMSKRVPYLM